MGGNDGNDGFIFQVAVSNNKSGQVDQLAAVAQQLGVIPSARFLLPDVNGIS